MSSDSGGMGAASSSQVQVDVGNIDANTDELETLIGATNTALSSVATEATLATRASEATLATRASEATLATRATEATLATRASETTLATRASEAKQDTQITRLGTNGDAADVDGTQAGQLRYIGEAQDTQLTRAHGGTGASAVEVVTDAVPHGFTFHGIQVIEAVTLTALTDTNLSGNSLATATLQPGYHPIAGTSITKAAGGLMYLIGA